MIVAAACASAQQTTSGVKFFARGGAVVGLLGDFKTAVGPSVTVGLTLPFQHSVEFEASYFETEDEDFSWFKVEFMPLLAKYRIPFPITPKLTGSVALAAGAMIEKSDFYGIWYYRERDTAFAGGVDAAIDYAVSERLSIGVGVTTLYLSESDITTDGSVALINARATLAF
jgi:hypothetical protein